MNVRLHLFDPDGTSTQRRPAQKNRWGDLVFPPSVAACCARTKCGHVCTQSGHHQPARIDQPEKWLRQRLNLQKSLGTLGIFWCFDLARFPGHLLKHRNRNKMLRFEDVFSVPEIIPRHVPGFPSSEGLNQLVIVDSDKERDSAVQMKYMLQACHVGMFK